MRVDTKGPTDHRSPIIEAEPTVFIIDDDPSVLKGLSRLLGSMGFHTEAFASAEQFLAREPYTGTGCIVLDIRMPGLSGMELQEELGKADHSIPIVFITGHGDIPMSVQAMKMGAVDFLPKPFDDEALLDAVRNALEKDLRAKTGRRETREAVALIRQLTPREQEILPYITSGMLNKQVAFRLGIAEKTVKVHRGRIMGKLGVTSVADLVRLAEKAGIEVVK